MASIDDLLKSDRNKGIAIGLGIAVLAPAAVAAISTIGRPAARAAIKAGLIVYEKGRETAAEVGEVVQDLVAEARAELEDNRHSPYGEHDESETDSSPGGSGSGDDKA